jgi:DNA-binding LytR/AlgR family response regulator
VDLAFLDIKMPFLGGLELIENLRAKVGRNIPSFILTTGHPEFALSGYQQGAIGYLVKPVEFKEFKITVERLIDSWKKNASINDVNVDKDYFFIESDGARIKLKYKDIAYLESDGNYIKLVESNADRLIYNRPMRDIERILSNHGFVRVHKSYIVSMHYIKELRGNEIILNGFDKVIPVGSTHKSELQKRMNTI